MQIADRVVLLTGTRRIGAVIAEYLARRGALVALGYHRSQDVAESVARKVRHLGHTAEPIRADLSSPKGCQALIETTVSRLGRLDALVNLASVYHPRPFDALDAATWDATLRIDLASAWACSRAAIPHMRRAGAGRIVNFSDWTAASHRPRYVGYVPYYVAKAGVVALTEALALELAADGILVNCIAPGPILPPPGASPEEVRAVEEATPVGRWGGAPQVAQAVLALLETDFVTGETIRVDGGRHLA